MFLTLFDGNKLRGLGKKVLRIYLQYGIVVVIVVVIGIKFSISFIELYYADIFASFCTMMGTWYKILVGGSFSEIIKCTKM